MFHRQRARVRVLLALAQDPAGPHYGLTLCESAKVGSGAIYPILARMEQAHEVASYWVELEEGHPRRRGYHLTLKGQMAAAEFRRADEAERNGT